VLIDGYIRVSQVRNRHGDRFISPAVQREQIEGWAKLNGVVIGEVFEELDESGARRDRPKLLQALARVESGKSDGIVVAKLDRFGRSLRDSLDAIERLQAAGGTFVSVQDGLDLGSPTGKLVLRIMFSMAEWELDRIRTNWKDAKRKAVERGVHVGSWAPFGYRRDRTGRLKPDPTMAPILIDIFRQRATGMSIRGIGRLLEARDIKTIRGNPGWSERSVRYIIGNRVYLGEVRAGPHVRTGAHQALVDQVLWQTAQNPCVLPERRRRLPTLLGGLLRCAGCSMALHSGTVGRAGGRRQSEYSCHGRSAAGQCESPGYLAGGLVEPYVERAFFSRLRREQRSKRRSSRRLNALKKQLAKSEAAVEAYRDHPRLEAMLGTERFETGLVKRLKTRDDAMRLLAREARRIQSSPLPEASVLEERWPQMTIEERRAAIGEVIDCVFVWPGPGGVSVRTHICYRGEAPPDLPRFGLRRSKKRRITREDLVPEPKVDRPTQWSRDRINRELNEFLSQHDEWPSENTFCREGRGPLHARVMMTGGPAAWARRFGLDPPRGRTAVFAWSEDDVRATLKQLVRGRRTFPSRRQLLESGNSSLLAWMQRNRGLDFWAAEVGLPRPRPGPQSPEKPASGGR
jgi:DNA invertase Pin-like site-specific DNA recombinase